LLAGEGGERGKERLRAKGKWCPHDEVQGFSLTSHVTTPLNTAKKGKGKKKEKEKLSAKGERGGYRAATSVLRCESAPAGFFRYKKGGEKEGVRTKHRHKEIRQRVVEPTILRQFCSVYFKVAEKKEGGRRKGKKGGKKKDSGRGGREGALAPLIQNRLPASTSPRVGVPTTEKKRKGRGRKKGYRRKGRAKKIACEVCRTFASKLCGSLFPPERQKGRIGGKGEKKNSSSQGEGKGGPMVPSVVCNLQSSKNRGKRGGGKGGKKGNTTLREGGKRKRFV